MSVRRLSNSTISTQGRGKSSTFIAGYSPAIDEMDLIERVVVGSGGTSSITFSNIPQTYQHLQLRINFKSLQTISSSGSGMRFNLDSGNNYARHDLGGDGSSATAANGVSINFLPIDGRADTFAQFGASIVDILDYSLTIKNKVIRTFFGMDSNGSGGLIIGSGLWINTAAINQIILYGNNFNGFTQYTTASLYGVKA